MGTFSQSANTQYLHQWGNYDNPLITGTGRVWGKPAWQTSSPYKNKSSQAWEKLKIFKWMVISAWVKDNQRGRQVRRKTRIHILQVTFLSLLLASHSPFQQKHRIHFIVFIEVLQCSPSSSSSLAPHLLGEKNMEKHRQDAPKLMLAESQPLAVTTSSYWFLHSKLTAGSRHCAVLTGVRC